MHLTNRSVHATAAWPQLSCSSAARQMAPDGLSSCYTVVQPGLKSGSMYMELQIQSMRPSSRGSGGLKFWVVRLGCRLAQQCARLLLCTCCLTQEMLWNCCGGI